MSKPIFELPKLSVRFWLALAVAACLIAWLAA
jgi:hypothetical protein